MRLRNDHSDTDIRSVVVRPDHAAIVETFERYSDPKLAPYGDELRTAHGSEWARPKYTNFRVDVDGQRLVMAFDSLDPARRNLSRSDLIEIADGLPSSLEPDDIATVFARRSRDGVDPATVDRLTADVEPVMWPASYPIQPARLDQPEPAQELRQVDPEREMLHQEQPSRQLDRDPDTGELTLPDAPDLDVDDGLDI